MRVLTLGKLFRSLCTLTLVAGRAGLRQQIAPRACYGITPRSSFQSSFFHHPQIHSDCNRSRSFI